jgi:glycosyltransferase involved in cell wall biosynthesis
MPMKILFAVQASALHAARWINQFKASGCDIHVMENLVPGWGICPEFECGEFHVPQVLPSRKGVTSVCTFRGNHWYGLRKRFGLAMPTAWLQEQHEDYLAKWIHREKPDAIHLLGLGVNWINQGVPLLRIKKRLGGFSCPLVYSSWGTDLDFFGQDPGNQAGVRAVLGQVDVFVSECERDCRLAKDFGFRGVFGGYFPAFGGTKLEEVNRHRLPWKSSGRRLILVKGRDHASGGDPIGRALTVMRALGRCADEIKQAGCRVAILQPDSTVTAEAHVLRATTGLEIELLPRLPYEGLLRLMGAARVVAAMTINDGLPSILVEAMAFGALPLHSDLEPIREWVEDGKNGLLVGAEDAEATAAAIRRAVRDDDLVDCASEINGRLVAEKLEYKAVRQRAIDLYERISTRPRK